MIEIYGKANCPNCDAAKTFLNVRGAPYHYKQLGADFTTEELLAKAPSAKTFPQIFWNGQLVGGYTDLINKFGLIESTLDGPQVLNG
jgi:glutaredoxin